MPDAIEKRCSCGALLCKIEGKTVQLQAKKGMAKFEPAGGSFDIECVCGKPNTVQVEQPIFTGTLNRVPQK